jgi:predicted dienelactone hydrolase
MIRYPARSGRPPHRQFRPAILGLSTFLLLAVFFPSVRASDYASPGPYSAGWNRVTIQRADRSTFTARLYYPARARGQDAPYEKAGAPYPAIAFGHGYQINPSYYASTLEHLASWGYFVCAPESGLELFPGHKKFAEDLSRCFTYLEQENAGRRSPYKDQVDLARLGIAGHSMGGGAAHLAAASDPRVRAVVTLAAAETSPSARAAMPSIAAPVRLIVGSADGIVSPSQTAGIYGGGRAPRQLSILQGGAHCGFLDNSYAFCDNGAMARGAQLAHTRRLLTDFFNLYLRADQGAWREVWGPDLLAIPDVGTQADSGISLAGSETAAGAPGSAAAHRVTLTNSGPRAASFSLFFEGNGWETAVTPAQTAVLSPGESVTINVNVQVPADAASGASDVLLLSARNDADGGTRAHINITTAAQ